MNQKNKNKWKRTNQALFLKLDGVIINTRSGEERPIDTFDWMLLTDTLIKIKEFFNKNWYIVIVSCQGYLNNYDNEEVDFTTKLNAVISDLLLKTEIDKSKLKLYWTSNRISRNFFPEPGLAERAEKELDLDLKECIMVGTHILDYKFSKNAGIERYYDYLGFINL